jgi:hypothetical protein
LALFVLIINPNIDGLLASGEVKDEHELRFLANRLDAMKNAEIQTPVPKYGQPEPAPTGKP